MKEEDWRKEEKDKEDKEGVEWREEKEKVEDGGRWGKGRG